MKRLTPLLILLIFSFCSANAAVEILTYEQLMTIDGPCTVYVEAKTGEPAPMHMKSILMDNTQWQWMVKDSSGIYRASGHYMNMTAYKAMNVSARSLILNHKECRLEVQVSGPGQWSVVNIRAASKPVTFSGVFWPLIIMLLMAVIITPLIFKYINAPTEGTQPRQWRPSKLLVGAFFLSELFKNDKKK